MVAAMATIAPCCAETGAAPAGITIRQSFERDGLRVAVAQMHCPRDELRLDAINHPLDSPFDQDHPERDQVGVRGCGKLASLMYYKGRWTVGTLYDSPLISNRGEPTELPPSLRWCSDAGRERERAYRMQARGSGRECPDENAACRMLREHFRRCAEALIDDLASNGRYEVHGQVQGSVVMGLTTGSDGRIQDACLLHSDLGNTPSMLTCFTQALRGLRVLAPPNLNEIPWEFRWAPEEPRGPPR
jgi:hypothetical protein